MLNNQPCSFTGKGLLDDSVARERRNERSIANRYDERLDVGWQSRSLQIRKRGIGITRSVVSDQQSHRPETSGMPVPSVAWANFRSLPSRSANATANSTAQRSTVEAT